MRNAFRGAIEGVMKQCLDYRVKRTLAFWRDESEPALQAVDYLTWAVTRFYERKAGSFAETTRHGLTSLLGAAAFAGAVDVACQSQQATQPDEPSAQ
jgi:hypothetical protein